MRNWGDGGALHVKIPCVLLSYRYTIERIDAIAAPWRGEPPIMAPAIIGAETYAPEQKANANCRFLNADAHVNDLTIQIARVFLAMLRDALAGADDNANA